MSNKTALLFGIHMHQPVDNFAWVIDRAVERCYGPFFEIMARYPHFKFAVHCSGWLLEQIRTGHPGLFERMCALAKAGSIEFFGAGYYEPVLSAIPSHDRRRQIRKLTRALEKEFDAEPKGLWLTERVWDASIIPDIASEGMRYAVIDDYHFRCTGFEQERLEGFYMTEEGGTPMGLFPISQALRYALPFFPVDDAIAAIKACGRERDSAAIIFDDAEKFGMWPKTFEWVYEKGWLEAFVERVLDDPSIKTMHYSDYFENHRSRGIAYLPNVSYFEMGEWSLRADDTLKLEAYKEAMGAEQFEAEGVKFLKGGIWKNFLVKYEESNRIHKRMLELSEAVAYVNDPAFEEAMFKLQTNDVLWHGVFGGLYLPNLRDNAYRYMIEAENIRYRRNEMVIETAETELDGFKKIKAVTEKLIMRFDAGNGGQMIEFDDRESCFNWQNTLTRRKEAYHAKMLEASAYPVEAEEKSSEGIDTIHTTAFAVSDELKAALSYDWYIKNSFVDHISDTSFSVERFRRCDFREYGDFANQPFEVDVNEGRICFEREGGIYGEHASFATLKKCYTPLPEGVDFSVELDSAYTQELNYVMEFNFHFSDLDHVTINGHDALGEDCIDAVEKIQIIDGYSDKKIVITFDKPGRLYFFALKTVSQSELGFDLSVQSLNFAISFTFLHSCRVKGRLEVSDV